MLLFKPQKIGQNTCSARYRAWGGLSLLFPRPSLKPRKYLRVANSMRLFGRSEASKCLKVPSTCRGIRLSLSLRCLKGLHLKHALQRMDNQAGKSLANSEQ